MEFVIAGLVVLLAVVAVLAGRVVQQHEELVDLRGRVGQHAAPGPDGEHDAIVIVIHNHDDVAANRSRLARAVSLLSPGLVRGLVHRETIREVRAQLAEQGVEADVRVRRVVHRDGVG